MEGKVLYTLKNASEMLGVIATGTHRQLQTLWLQIKLLLSDYSFIYSPIYYVSGPLPGKSHREIEYL